MEINVEEAAKGWIACAMEIRGYTPYEIRSVMETAYQCRHDTGVTPEDAANQYRHYRPERETRLLAAREAAV